jgi:acetyl esterase/lipase
MATDLTNLPSAYVVTCQYDVLRDDGILYARRLQDSGVPTELKVYKGMGVWQGVAMDSLKFHPGLSCPTRLCPRGRRPAANFYPFGHPTLYTYVQGPGTAS